MIKIKNVNVYGFEPALRGMRNPKKSWDKSDSDWCPNMICKDNDDCPYGSSSECGGVGYIVGYKDYKLAMKLVRAGSVHAKFRRMIAVWVDITAPRYFWTEFDTYKVGTVCNSESTMHTIHQKPFELDDFSHEKMSAIDLDIYGKSPLRQFQDVVRHLNQLRELYLKTDAKEYWYQIIQLLPQSYNQKRTVLLNYEVLANMYRQRKTHKLDEWKEFCKWIKTLPYSEFITGEEK